MSRTRLSSRLGYFVLYPKNHRFIFRAKVLQAKITFFPYILHFYSFSKTWLSRYFRTTGFQIYYSQSAIYLSSYTTVFYVHFMLWIKYKCRTFWCNTLYLKKGLEISLCHLLLLSQKCWTLYREPWYFCINEKVDSKNFSR